MEIINNNPYRLLGVYSTSSQKEVVANQGKMKAFLKVGRQVSFPLDLNELLPEIERSEQNVAEAISKLALPAEQLKYAQFWFSQNNHIDEIACGKLTNGDIDGAIEIWSKKISVSSLQNLLVCCLINNQIGKSIRYAQTLYSSYKNEFVKMVLGDNALASCENLEYDFLDVICKEFTHDRFLEYIEKEDWKDYVVKKSVKPIIEKISSAIDVCKSSKGKGARARLNAGTKLMNGTKKYVEELKQFMSSSDLQYQMIADKLGLEILQCGIDYYNGTEDLFAAKEALNIQSYAQSVVVGKMAKDRCRENVDILNEIIKKLPPMEVISEVFEIKEELHRFNKLPDKISYSVNLLNNTKSNLQLIKDKLGATNSYYLKISTQVVGNALHKVIAEVNSFEKDNTFISSQYHKYERRIVGKDSKGEPIYSYFIKSLSDVLRSAWRAIEIMDTFDMESDFENNRYLENREILSKMCSQVGVDIYSSLYSNSSPSSSYGQSSSSQSTKPSYTHIPSSDYEQDDSIVGTIIKGIIKVIIIAYFIGIIIGLIILIFSS